MKSCQSAVLMNNLAESYASIGQFEEAKIWGQKGLDLAQNPNTRQVNKDGEVCDETCGVLLFNMGMLFDVSVCSADMIYLFLTYFIIIIANKR